jgi:hypothetical protein
VIKNEINYQYDIRYNNRFPVIGEWMLMMDYNGDGKEDLFCDRNGGIACYQNISTDSSGLKFKLIIDQIIFSTTQFTIAIGVPSNDIPSIADVDGDGDLDILRFGAATITPGEPIEWFKNLTVEKTFHFLGTRIFPGIPLTKDGILGFTLPEASEKSITQKIQIFASTHNVDHIYTFVTCITDNLRQKELDTIKED